MGGTDPQAEGVVREKTVATTQEEYCRLVVQGKWKGSLLGK